MNRKSTLLLPLPLLLGSFSCSKEAPKPATAGVPAKPVAVQTAVAAAVDWPGTYTASGTVKAKASAIVAARVMGYVRAVNAQLGDRVRVGQLLVQLDTRDFDTALARATAAREEAKRGIPEADAAIAAAGAQLDLANLTLRRMQELFSKKSVSNQELDEASARSKAAQASVDMAKARRAQLDSRLQQAEQEVRGAELNRSYTEVTAPFSGIIAAKQVEPGSLASPGAPLFTIERDGALRLEAEVEESRLPSIRAGQSVKVQLDGVGKEIAGRVAEVVPTIDPAARSGIVKIDLPAMAELRAGLFGRAMFATGTRPAIAVAPAAVVEQGQIASVFVVDNGIARLRMVTIGQRLPDQWEVLSGLTAGETFIVQPPPGLADGAPVEVRQ